MKRFSDTETWKWIRTVFELLLIAVIVYSIFTLVSLFSMQDAKADKYENITEAYILCDDYVNIRRFPSNDDEPLGRFETGDTVLLDGKKKNGYLHCIDLSLEACEGWVHKGFVVYDKPIMVNQYAVIVSKGRLAARKYVGGRRTRWLKSGATVKVYYWSDEWCVTDCGYVKTEFLELVGE